MKLAIHDVHALDARSAAAELARQGMVAVDDISEGLIDCAWEEIFDELGDAADGMPLKTQRIETPWGPVFVMRDADRVSAAAARGAVLSQRPRLTRRSAAETVPEHHVAADGGQAGVGRGERFRRGRRA